MSRSGHCLFNYQNFKSMKTDEMVKAEEFCLCHQVDITFIRSLNEFGLVTLTTMEENLYIPTAQVVEIERMMRFHFDMNINLEGVEVITRLLKQMDDMRDEARLLRNRLNLYESDF